MGGQFNSITGYFQVAESKLIYLSGKITQKGESHSEDVDGSGKPQTLILKTYTIMSHKICAQSCHWNSFHDANFVIMTICDATSDGKIGIMKLSPYSVALLCFVVVIYRIHIISLPLLFRVASLAPGQSYDCSSARNHRYVYCSYIQVWISKWSNHSSQAKKAFRPTHAKVYFRIAH